MSTMLNGRGATVTESKDMLPLGETCDRCIQHANVRATIGEHALQFCRHHYNGLARNLHEQAQAVTLYLVRAD